MKFAYADPPSEVSEIVKRCTACGNKKPLNEFTWRKDRSTGRGISECKPCKVTRTLEWKSRHPRYYPENHRLRRYGITTEQYQEMLRAQSGRCAICEVPMARKYEPAIDHCHATNRIRGLLCLRCNSSLECAERPNWLANVQEYLDRHHPERMN